MKPITLQHAPVPDFTPPAKGKDTLVWKPPQTLAPKGDPEPYPLDALPPRVHAAVEDVQGFVKPPVALVASSALGALSLAVQAHADMKRAERLTGPVGLYLLTIAASGDRKSTCDRLFFQAIRDYERHQAQAAAPGLKAHGSSVAALEAKVNGIKIALTAAGTGEDTRALEAALAELEQQAPEAPRMPRLIYADVTPEQQKGDLAKVWPSAGVVTSEGGTVLGAHGMGQESIMRNLAIYNQPWDGADLPTDRRTSESFTVRGARLTIALQVQETTLRVFLHGSGELARGIGFLSRCLLAWPESTQGRRAFTDAPPGVAAAGSLQSADHLHPQPARGPRARRGSQPFAADLQARGQGRVGGLPRQDRAGTRRRGTVPRGPGRGREDRGQRRPDRRLVPRL